MNQAQLEKLLAGNPELSIVGQPERATKRQGYRTGTITSPMDENKTRVILDGAGVGLKIVMPNERPLTMNKIKGSHWSVSDGYKKSCYYAIRQQLAGDEPQFTKRVDIFVTAYFESQPQDSDNIYTKYYIDALRHYGIIADDNMDCVRWSASRAEVDRDDPRVEVLLVVVGGVRGERKNPTF